jgi:hypothetical protein
MFSARQERNKSVASWGSRIDEMQTELREAAKRVCKPEELLGAVGLINHLGNVCFVQGLNSERIQTIVRSVYLAYAGSGDFPGRGRCHPLESGKIWREHHQVCNF